MQEIYLFENTGQISLRPVTADTEVDAQLLQAAQEDNFDWMEPMFAGGDSELVYMTAFRHPQNAGGAVIVISGGGEHMFCVLARGGRFSVRDLAPERIFQRTIPSSASDLGAVVQELEAF